VKNVKDTYSPKRYVPFSRPLPLFPVRTCLESQKDVFSKPRRGEMIVEKWVIRPEPRRGEISADGNNITPTGFWNAPLRVLQSFRPYGAFKKSCQ